MMSFLNIPVLQTIDINEEKQVVLTSTAITNPLDTIVVGTSCLMYRAILQSALIVKF